MGHGSKRCWSPPAAVTVPSSARSIVMLLRMNKRGTRILAGVPDLVRRENHLGPVHRRSLHLNMLYFAVAAADEVITFGAVDVFNVPVFAVNSVAAFMALLPPPS